MESKEVEQKVKQKLRKIYLDLNPAQLKREIDDKLNKLFKDYKQKNKSQKLTIKKKLKPNMATSLIAETQQLSVTWLNCLTRYIKVLKYNKSLIFISYMNNLSDC